MAMTKQKVERYLDKEILHWTESAANVKGKSPNDTLYDFCKGLATVLKQAKDDLLAQA